MDKNPDIILIIAQVNLYDRNYESKVKYADVKFYMKRK